MDYCYGCQQRFSRRCPGCNRPDLRYATLCLFISLISYFILGNLVVSPFYKTQKLPQIEQNTEDTYQITLVTKKSTILLLFLPPWIAIGFFFLFQIIIPAETYRDFPKPGEKENRYLKQKVLRCLTEVGTITAFAAVFCYGAIFTDKEFSKIEIEDNTVTLKSFFSTEATLAKDQICSASITYCSDNNHTPQARLRIQTASGENYLSTPYSINRSLGRQKIEFALNQTASLINK